MIHFHNFKKLFLLLFCMQPLMIWGMEEKVKSKSEKCKTFYLVVPSKDKQKCRYLHRLLDKISDNRLNELRKTSQDREKMLNFYLLRLGVTKIIHRNFRIEDFQDKRVLSEEVSLPNGPLRYPGSTYPYEDVAFFLESEKTREEVKGLEELPFSAQVYTLVELSRWHAEWLAGMYESEDVPLIDLNDND